MSARTCDMCGKSTPEVRLSREHVFSQALRDTVDDHGDHVVTEAVGRKIAEFEYSQCTRPVNLMDVTARTVCERCNNGWMSKLESEANTTLRRLIDGTDSLTANDVNVVRLWCAKTAAVIEMAAARGDDDAPVAADDRAEIQNGVVPAGWIVTLTRLDRSWRHHIQRSHAPLPLNRIVGGEARIERYHFTVIGIGCMLATVIGGPPGSDACADVTLLTARALGRRVRAIAPLLPGRATRLGTWHAPDQATIQRLPLFVTALLTQENKFSHKNESTPTISKQHPLNR
ncbi:hypothetical protein P0W64_02330 [Tsukamurella sp. 8F]|uniref:hypothetical protein n=1 Tax=unclassified Tsukamurella TaxID=2633480 RepID=UPI0023B940A6|nr:MULTISPECIES: hypothetical protein [unclassified Tsukamurella]MDF0528645.1 hypothetical protein [Tsukamurella sp. 8J]MDF0585607.1 hypothetical protein [Tsukamurella sp. 8F]